MVVPSEKFSAVYLGDLTQLSYTKFLELSCGKRTARQSLTRCITFYDVLEFGFISLGWDFYFLMHARPSRPLNQK